jgi:hypothetical protein
MLTVAVYCPGAEDLPWQELVGEELISSFVPEIDMQVHLPVTESGLKDLLTDLKQGNVRLDLLIIPGFAGVDGTVLLEMLRSSGVSPLFAVVVVGAHPADRKVTKWMWQMASGDRIRFQRIIITHDLEATLIDERDRIMLYVRGS